MQSFELSDPVGRIQFALELYNLGSMLKHEGDNLITSDAVSKLRTTVQQYKKDYCLPTFRSRQSTKGKRKRSHSDEGDQTVGGRGSARHSGSAAHQLQAHGYGLIPDSFEDESGGLWERLIQVRTRNCFLQPGFALTFDWQLPRHVRTVYRVTDPKRVELIAKQVREHSNELAILQYLRNIQPQSPHVISLIGTVSTRDWDWLILPKLLPIVELSFNTAGAQLHARLVRYSHDLIKGLAYLHTHRVAHLDIKPNNLVCTNHGPLQIIDFDSAVFVQNEDEKIKGLCGTHGWRAPEIGDDEDEVAPPPVFNPIRADRWSCGRVILELVQDVGGEGAAVVKFAKRLMDVDPNCRPSLLDWDGLNPRFQVRS